MTNLPEQAHQRGTALATRPEDDPYALDSSDVILPRLHIAQYQSDAFKRRLVDYGDLFISIGREDSNPQVLAKAGEPLSEPLRFYIHRLQRGFNYREDPTDQRMTFGPLGGTFQQALQFTQGDPRRVYQKHDYVITAPVYATLPIRFLMTSTWGGQAAKWINTQIGILKQEGKNPLETAFVVRSRPGHNDKGDFASAVVAIADLKAKDREKDMEIVYRHAELLSTTTISDDDIADAVEAPATATDVPDLG